MGKKEGYCVIPFCQISSYFLGQYLAMYVSLHMGKTALIDDSQEDIVGGKGKFHLQRISWFS